VAVDAVVVAPAGFNWTGFFGGVHVGYGWANNSLTNSSPPGPDTRTIAIRPNGVLGGVQVGYNYQSGRAVFGVVADLSYLGMSGSFVDPGAGPPPGPAYTATSKIEWTGTIRGRLGFLVTPSMLAYAHGGLAVGGVRGTWIANPGPGPWNGVGSATRAGWTVGAGLEYKWTQNLSAFAEYSYVNLGTHTFNNLPGPGPAVSFRHKVEAHVVKIGLNYHFTTGPSAVVARY